MAAVSHSEDSASSLGRAPADVQAVAAIAKALGHPARLAIVQVIAERGVCSGGEIVEAIGLAQSTTAEHLRILRSAGLIQGEIERPRVSYSLNAGSAGPLSAFLSTFR